LLDQKGNQKIKAKKGDSCGPVHGLCCTLCCAKNNFNDLNFTFRTTRFRLPRTYRLFFAVAS
jgi:hypothetical protein